VYYLNAYQFIDLNTLALIDTDEASFVRNPHGLDAIEHLSKQNFFGREAYPKIEEKLGIVFIKLINLHCFEDANKRTAVLALQTLADLNDHDLTYTSEEMYELALKVAATDDADLDYNAVYRSIRDHLV